MLAKADIIILGLQALRDTCQLVRLFLSDQNADGGAGELVLFAQAVL